MSDKVGADDAVAAGLQIDHLPRAEAPEPHCTDLGNSERFVRQHGADVRYCWPWKTWLQWTGTKWERDPGDGIRERAKATARRLYQDAALREDPHERKALAAWAQKSEADHVQRAMIEMAKSAISIRPHQFDADPWLLNVANGTLDLRAGELHAHRRGDWITKQCPTPYDPRAACPKFLAFLDLIFHGDVVLIAWLQALLGSGLVGQAIDQILPIFWGSGANGKSTLVQAVADVLGEDYALDTPISTFLVKRDGIPNDLARLAGARLVIGSESEDGRRLNESLVKQLTGGDTITARFLNEEWFSFKPTFTLLMTTNHKPEIRGTDLAIWRRLRLVPFTVTIPLSEQDEQFPERVLLPEAPGILGWLVAGCRRWQREGLKAVPESVTAATDEYRMESDLLGDFLEEKTVRGQDCFASTTSLYDVYLQFCEATKEKRPIGKIDFTRRLGGYGFRSDKVGGIRGWWGLEIR
jgi:putative DNA primase/helicase